MKLTLNFKKQLSPNTLARVLEHLESQPLGKVYGLFQTIISELAEDSANGPVANSERLTAAPSGSGNPDGGNSGISAVPSEQGGS